MGSLDSHSTWTRFRGAAQSGDLQNVLTKELQRDLLAWTPLIRDLRDDQIRFSVFQASEVMPYLVSEVHIRGANLWLPAIATQGAVPRPSVPVGTVPLTVTMRLRNFVSLQSRAFGLLTSQSTEALAMRGDLEGRIRDELGRE